MEHQLPLARTTTRPQLPPAGAAAVRRHVTAVAAADRVELTDASLRGRPLYEGALQHFRAAQALDFIGQDVAEARAKNATGAARLGSVEERLQAALAALRADAGPPAPAAPTSVVMAAAPEPAPTTSQPAAATADDGSGSGAVRASRWSRSRSLSRASRGGGATAMAQLGPVDATGVADRDGDEASAATADEPASRALAHDTALVTKTGAATSASGGGGGDGGGEEVGAHSREQQALGAAAARRHAFLAVMDVKRSQYRYRINVLAAQAAEAGQRYVALADTREELKATLRSSDQRYRVLAAELAVVAGYRGELIDSGVMHGRAAGQRFPARELVALVRGEMGAHADAVADAKARLVGVRADMDAAHADKCRLQAAADERRAALDAFDATFGNRGRMMAIVNRIALRGQARAWQTWREYVAQRRAGKAALRALVARGEEKEVAHAWRLWRRATAARRARADAELAAERRHARGGIGETALSAVHGQRTAAVDDTVALLSWLRRVEGEIAAGEASAHERLALRDETGAGDGGAGVPELGPAYDMTQLLLPPPHAAGGSDGGVTAPPPLLELEAGPDADTAPALTAILASAFDVDTNRDGGKALAAALVRDRAAAPTSTQVLNARKAAALVAELGPDAVLSPLVRPALDAHLRRLLDTAWTHFSIGQWADCLGCLKRAELVYGYRKDAVGLLAVYRMLSRLLERVGRPELAMLHWERCKQLARETRDGLAATEAAEGLGRALAARGYHADALREYAAAEATYTRRNDLRALARLRRLQAAACRLLDRLPESAAHTADADAIEHRLASFIRSGADALRGLQEALYGMGVAHAVTVTLEACGPVLPLLRQQARYLQRQRHTHRAVIRATRRVRDEAAARLEAVTVELAAAAATGAPKMASSVLDDTAAGNGSAAGGGSGAGAPRQPSGGQLYVVAELVARLHAAADDAAATIAEADRELAAYDLRVHNVDTELAALAELAVAEGGPLAQRVAAGRPLRAVRLNAANPRTNNVLGAAEGGHPTLAAAQDSAAFAHDTRDGAAVSSFAGDSAATPLGDPLGHTKPVTSLCLYGDRLYTGSQDATIRVWDVGAQRGWGARGPVEAEVERDEAARLRAALAHAAVGADGQPLPVVPQLRDDDAPRRRRAGLLLTLRGHTGTVTALAANASLLVSGSADHTVAVWDAASGALLRVLHGHDLAVTCASLDDATFATGSADCSVRMWQVEPRRRAGFGAAVTCRWRGLAHDAPVTALSCVGREAVSGDASGVVVVWDDATGTPIRTLMGLHGGRAVHALQFDAYKLVSAGGDDRLVVSDLSTGDVLQVTLAPHGGARVSDLQFDTDRLVTVAVDRTLRVWEWKGGSASAAAAAAPHSSAPSRRSHLVQPGDSLASIARRHSVSVRQLRRWNAIGDPAAQFYEGRRLLIEPPPVASAAGAAFALPPGASPLTAPTTASVASAAAAAAADGPEGAADDDSSDDDAGDDASAFTAAPGAAVSSFATAAPPPRNIAVVHKSAAAGTATPAAVSDMTCAPAPVPSTPSVAPAAVTVAGVGSNTAGSGASGFLTRMFRSRPRQPEQPQTTAKQRAARAAAGLREGAKTFADELERPY